jgi:hypothetical protein
MGGASIRPLSPDASHLTPQQSYSLFYAKFCRPSGPGIRAQTAARRRNIEGKFWFSQRRALPKEPVEAESRQPKGIS